MPTTSVVSHSGAVTSSDNESRFRFGDRPVVHRHTFDGVIPADEAKRAAESAMRRYGWTPPDVEGQPWRPPPSDHFTPPAVDMTAERVVIVGDYHYDWSNPADRPAMREVLGRFAPDGPHAERFRSGGSGGVPNPDDDE